MKQVVVTKGEFRVIDVPEPTPGPGEVLVRVSHSLISSGTEMSSASHSSRSLARTVLRDPKLIKRAAAAVVRSGLGAVKEKAAEADAPRPLGYSCAGYVVAAGERAPGFEPRQLVACAGASHANHAEVVAVPRNLVARVPEGVSPEQAATATVGSIALQGVRRAEVSVGEVVAVIGLGLIGQLAVQILRAAGCQVIGVDIDEGRVALAEQLGATVGVLAGRDDPVRLCLHHTHGHGVDACMITAATESSEPVQQAMELTRKRGRVVVVGGVGLELQRSPLYEKEIDFRISCSYGPGRYDPEYEEEGIDYPYAYVRWTENRNLAAFLELLRDGKVDVAPLIDRRVTIDKAPAGYAALANETPRPLGVIITYPGAEEPAIAGRKQELQYAPRRVGEKRIRIAVIGGGNFTQKMHLPNLRKLEDLYSLEGIVTRTPLNARRLADQWGARFCATDYQEALADDAVEAVLIATPHELHAQMAIEAAEAGKAVFLEKPMAIHEEELERLVEVLQKTGVPFTVGFNRRFAPLAVRLKDGLAGRGGPLMVHYRVNGSPRPLSQATDDDPATSRAIGEACHMFDFFNYLVACDTSGVAARAIGVPEAPGLQRDNFVATVSYADGSVCNLVYTTLGHDDLPKERIEVFAGARAFVLNDFRELTEYAPSGTHATSGKQDKGHVEELREFAEFCRPPGTAPIALGDLVAAGRLALRVDQHISGGTQCLGPVS